MRRRSVSKLIASDLDCFIQSEQLGRVMGRAGPHALSVHFPARVSRLPPGHLIRSVIARHLSEPFNPLEFSSRAAAMIIVCTRIEPFTYMRLGVATTRAHVIASNQ